jgi:hypothetical protein
MTRARNENGRAVKPADGPRHISPGPSSSAGLALAAIESFRRDHPGEPVPSEWLAEADS